MNPWPVVIGPLLFLAACTAQPQVSRGTGAQLYAQTCVSCHGPDAAGNGPLAEDLPVPPTNLTRLAMQNGGNFPYTRVMEQIHGYPGRFHVMPEFGPLLAGPDVNWRAPDGTSLRTPRPLLDLATYLASIQEEI